MRRAGCLVLLSCGCLARPEPKSASAPLNHAFVTRLPRTLGSFAGLSAIDGMCADLGAAHAMPGNYVAWFSQPGMNAIDRLSGFRGWIRADGEPFADTTQNIIDGVILNPLRVDEYGTDVGDDHHVATATAPDGTYEISSENTATCWGDPTAPGSVEYGVSDGTILAWTSMGDTAVGCGVDVRFYCFEVDHTNPLPAASHAGRLAFLSSQSTSGNVGRGALDGLCQADAGQLPGSPQVMALIATGGASPLSRFDLTGADWVRPDHVRFMSGDGTTVGAPLNVALDMSYTADTVWTGALTRTAAPDPGGNDNCSDWSVGSLNAQAGSTIRSSADRAFGGSSVNQCSSAKYRLYCLEP